MDRPLLSMRSSLIFLLAVLTGGVASGLTAAAGEGVARSLLAGLAAAGLAVPFFNRLIATEESTVRPQGTTGASRGEGEGRE